MSDEPIQPTPDPAPAASPAPAADPAQDVPAAPEPQGTPEPQPVSTASVNPSIGAAKPTFLIVEDDKVLQELYYDRFSMAGFTVFQAYDGVQALEQLDVHPEIQLVLLDIMLPKLSGYDVLARMKQSKDTQHIPVIIVSALADIDDQARGLQLGAAEYITKGEMLPGAIIEKIKRYVLTVPRPAAE